MPEMAVRGSFDELDLRYDLDTEALKSRKLRRSDEKLKSPHNDREKRGERIPKDAQSCL
jgi:hypothetical protein